MLQMIHTEYQVLALLRPNSCELRACEMFRDEEHFKFGIPFHQKSTRAASPTAMPNTLDCHTGNDNQTSINNLCKK
jgi:hypothetical protein